MNENGHNSKVLVAEAPPKRKRSSWPILVLAVLFVTATGLTWYYTWFGRDLTDDEITTYLADEKHPRHVQHALLQLQQRLEQKKPVQQWHGRLIELSHNSETEFRMTVAWLMGNDNSSVDFHQALLSLLHDNEPLVRRNAALALVRFGDGEGRETLLGVLKPYAVDVSADGILSSTLNAGSTVSRGTLLARISQSNGDVTEVRSPMPGKIEQVVKRDGTTVKKGEPLMMMNSDANSIWEALRGLTVVGKSEDLGEIERYETGVDALPERIKQQAALTAKAIQSRSVQSSLKS